MPDYLKEETVTDFSVNLLKIDKYNMFVLKTGSDASRS